MADDAVPVSFVRTSTDAPAAPPLPSRRPATPAGGKSASGKSADCKSADGRSNDRQPIFKELPQQNSQASLNIDLLRDVELTVKIELGRTRMRLQDVLELGEGAVIELDRLAGDPVDVFVNDRLVARGEVVVIDNKFAVRLTEVAAPVKDD
jgi:flagellar motor switch protein FliN/FliY